MTDVLAKPDKLSYLLVEFWTGDPNDWTYVRYTDWTQDVLGITGEDDVDTATYTSTPTLELKLSPKTGGVEERPSTISLPLDDFTTPICSGFPHSPVFIRIWEHLVASDTTEQNILLFVGRATKFTKNDDGNRKRVKLELSNWKDLMNASAAFPAVHQCVWTVGDSNCQVDEAKFDDQITDEQITAIDGTIVTIPTAPAHMSDPTNRFWHNGFLLRNGLRLVIRDWKNDNPTKFNLQQRPPDDWLNAIVTLVPGCDYRAKTCDGRYGNLEHFQGSGIAIPGYSPLFQLPAKD